MSAATEQVIIEALSLPTRDRASLVRRLLVSLEDEEGSAEIEAAWKHETIERCAAFDKGQVTERDVGAVFRDAYGKVK